MYGTSMGHAYLINRGASGCSRNGALERCCQLVDMPTTNVVPAGHVPASEKWWEAFTVLCMTTSRGQLTIFCPSTISGMNKAAILTGIVILTKLGAPNGLCHAPGASPGANQCYKCYQRNV